MTLRMVGPSTTQSNSYNTQLHPVNRPRWEPDHMSAPATSPYLFTDEAAAYVRCHVDTIRKAIQRGSLKAKGRRPYTIHRSELDRWNDERAN